MRASVVSSRPATEAPFWRAERVTLVGIDDAGGEHVAPLLALGVVAEPGIGALLDPVDDDGAVDPGVIGDVAGGLFDGAADDLGPMSLRRR